MGAVVLKLHYFAFLKINVYFILDQTGYSIHMPFLISFCACCHCEPFSSTQFCCISTSFLYHWYVTCHLCIIGGELLKKWDKAAKLQLQASRSFCAALKETAMALPALLGLGYDCSWPLEGSMGNFLCKLGLIDSLHFVDLLRNGYLLQKEFNIFFSFITHLSLQWEPKVPLLFPFSSILLSQQSYE